MMMFNIPVLYTGGTTAIQLCAIWVKHSTDATLSAAKGIVLVHPWSLDLLASSETEATLYF